MIKYHKSKSGLDTVVFDNFYLHSRYDPVKEAKRVINNNNLYNYKDLLIIGDSLGYTCDLLLSNNQNIINIDFFPEFLLYKKKRFLMFSARFLYFHYNDFFPDIFYSFYSHYHPYFFPVYEKLFPKEILSLKRYFFSSQQKKQINVSTRNKFWRSWIQNFISNSWYLWNTDGLKSLFNVLKDKPVVIVGAGPSAFSGLKVLKEIQKKVYIIAVDTVFELLIQNSIFPDFLVSIDPQHKNFTYLKNSNLSNTITIIQPTVSKELLRKKPGIFCFSSLEIPLLKTMESSLGVLGDIFLSGSVGCTSINIAFLLGANPIFLLGHDLSFSNGQIHFRGIQYEKQILNKSSRFYHIAHDIFSSSKRGEIFLYQKSDNSSIITDHRFFVFKKWIETFLKKIKNKVYIINEQLPISGTIPLNIMEFKRYFQCKNLKKKNIKFITKDKVVEKDYIIYNFLESYYNQIKQYSSLSNNEIVNHERKNGVFFDIIDSNSDRNMIDKIISFTKHSINNELLKFHSTKSRK